MDTEAAETTKMGIVYDASVKGTPESASIKECLYPGPPLQRKLWDALVRQRAYPAVRTLSVPTGDIQRASLQIRIRECEHDAFQRASLQIRIRECEHDALRGFHWRKGEQSKIEVWRFTHALFGLALPPFLLGGVLEAHLDAWEEREPDMVVELI